MTNTVLTFGKFRAREELRLELEQVIHLALHFSQVV
jgi:hypothetical protein